MSWIDIVFIAILALFAIIGIVKGLLESILSLVSTGVAFGLSIWIGKPAAKFLRGIVDIDGWFEKLLAKASDQDPIADFLGVTITREQLAKFLTVVLCVIVVFILIKLIVLLLAKLFDNAIQNNTGFSGLNRVLGMLFGACKGIFIICCGLAICSFVTWIPGIGSKVTNAINDTKITSFVYKYVDEFVEDKMSEEKIKEVIGIEDQTIVSATVPEDSSLFNMTAGMSEELLYSNAKITITFSDNSTVTIEKLVKVNFKTGELEGLDISTPTNENEPRVATVTWSNYTFTLTYVVNPAI